MLATSGGAAFAQSSVLVYVINADGAVSGYVTDGIGLLTPRSPATVALDSGPTSLVMRPDQAFVYVARLDRGVSVIDTASQTLVQTTTGSASAGAGYGIAISPDGRTVYEAIQNGGSGGRVQVFSANVSTGELTATASIPVHSPALLAVSPDGSRLYVPNEYANSVSVIDTETNAVIDDIPVGSRPVGAAVHPDGSRVYVTNFGSNTISVIDVTTDPAAVATVTGAGLQAPRTIAITPDGDHYYVANSPTGQIAQFQTSNNTTVAPAVDIGSNVYGLAVSPDGSFIYATDSAPSSTVFGFTDYAGTGQLVANGSIASTAFSLGAAMCRTTSGSFAAGATFFVTDRSYVCISPHSVFTGGTLQMPSGGLGIVVPLTFAPGGAIVSMPAGGRHSLSEDLSGPGGLAVTGPGLLDLYGSNTYAGPTIVDGASVLLHGSTGASSAMVVRAGGRLGGEGTAAGPVTIENTASIAPGNGTGEMHSGALTLHAGGDFLVDLNGPAPVTEYGRLTVTGTVTLGGNLIASFNFTPAIGHVFTILDNDGGDAISGTFAGLPEGAVAAFGGVQARISYVGGSGNDVTLTAVAQPSLTGASSAGVAYGGTVSDTATLASGLAPGGTIQFLLFGAGDTSCAGSPIFSDTTPAAGNGSYASGAFTPPAAGVYRWRAAYSGDASNAPATTACNQAGQSVTVSKANQTIDFTLTVTPTYGDGPFAVSATATSTLPVTFSSLTTGVCAMADATHVQIVSAGTCTIAATQAGDGNFATAPQVTASVTIAQAAQTIDFTLTVTPTYGDGPFAVSATATSTLPVTFSSLTTAVCAMADATHVQIVAAGTCTIAATQGGDGNYATAPQVTASVTIAQAAQMIEFAPLQDRILGAGPFGISATASSSLPVTFDSSTPAVCTVSSGTVTLVTLGACTIAATQAGNGNYGAAAPVTRSFAVLPDCSALSLMPGQLRVALAGTPYSQSFSIANGAGPSSFTLEGALPAGLTFSNGAIAGTPSGRGAFPITITGTDANACQVSASFTLGVSSERHLVAGAGGIGSAVRSFASDGTVRSGFDAYAHGFTGGVSVAQGDVNGDGVADLVTGAGPGGGPHVLVFDGATRAVRASFFAFDPAFTGGVEVATGDVTGDGNPEILATAGCGGPSVVRAFNGRTGALVREYAVALPAPACGLHVAAGDVNGDGIVDPIVGAGGGPSPTVTVIDGYTGGARRQFLAYLDGFPGGVYVAAGDVTGDGLADIVTGAGPSGGPHVRVFDGATGQAIAGPLASFFAYEPGFPGGVRVAAGDLNGDGRADVMTGAGPGGGPHVRVFDGATGREILGTFAFDPAFSGGVFLAAPPPIARMAIDLPSSNVSGTAVRIAGWALKQTSIDTPGVDIMNAWALPVGGGAPIFVAGAVIDGARADVASVFGGEYLTSGFDVTGTLAPGTYDLAVFVRNSRTRLFDQLRIVRITVN